ncbi:armadillo-type protein [Mycena maculata]|uniref:Armadillo-type protein n=1 Tax=Mycena maculata TaxID=230809 RepID=A0AAD7NEK4_9AGAR|nr:armadillo-type protein [Mycena maculata]
MSNGESRLDIRHATDTQDMAQIMAGYWTSPASSVVNAAMSRRWDQHRSTPDHMARALQSLSLLDAWSGFWTAFVELNRNLTETLDLLSTGTVVLALKMFRAKDCCPGRTPSPGLATRDPGLWARSKPEPMSSPQVGLRVGLKFLKCPRPGPATRARDQGPRPGPEPGYPTGRVYQAGYSEVLIHIHNQRAAFTRRNHPKPGPEPDPDTTWGRPRALARAQEIRSTSPRPTFRPDQYYSCYAGMNLSTICQYPHLHLDNPTFAVPRAHLSRQIKSGCSSTSCLAMKNSSCTSPRQINPENPISPFCSPMAGRPRPSRPPSIESWWTDRNPPGTTIDLHALAKPLLKALHHQKALSLIAKGTDSLLENDSARDLGTYLTFKEIWSSTRALVLAHLSARAYGDESDARAIVEGEALDCAMFLIQSTKDVNLRGLACTLVGNVASYQALHAAILRLEPCADVADCLLERGSEIRASAMYALSQIARWSEDGARAVVETRALQSSAELLLSADSHLLSSTCFTLGNIAAHPSLKANVLELSPLPGDHTQHRQSGVVQEKAAYALACISAGSEAGAHAVVDAAVLPRAPTLLASTNPDTLAFTCFLLGNIARHKVLHAPLLAVHPCIRLVALAEFSRISLWTGHWGLLIMLCCSHYNVHVQSSAQYALAQIGRGAHRHMAKFMDRIPGGRRMWDSLRHPKSRVPTPDPPDIAAGQGPLRRQYGYEVEFQMRAGHILQQLALRSTNLFEEWPIFTIFDRWLRKWALGLDSCVPPVSSEGQVLGDAYFLNLPVIYLPATSLPHLSRPESRPSVANPTQESYLIIGGGTSLAAASGRDARLNLDAHPLAPEQAARFGDSVRVCVGDILVPQSISKAVKSCGTTCIIYPGMVSTAATSMVLYPQGPDQPFRIPEQEAKWHKELVELHKKVNMDDVRNVLSAALETWGVGRGIAQQNSYLFLFYSKSYDLQIKEDQEYISLSLDVHQNLIQGY